MAFIKFLSSRNIRILCFSFLLFCICTAIGFFIAKGKTLWRDEIYTQLASVEDLSYADIILFRIKEGNICPLYYLIQKSICAILHYRLPEEVDTEYWTFKNPRAQIILRINPILFTSLAITLIFAFFAWGYSFFWGIYSIIVSMSSFMIWAYWAEARPYGLFMFLTTIQTIFFLQLLREDNIKTVHFLVFLVINILLSLCSIFSIIQIVTTAIILCKKFPRLYKKVLATAAFPSSICVIYYIHSPHYQFWFKDGPLQLISANIPKDRLLLLIILGIYILLQYILGRRHSGQIMFRRDKYSLMVSDFLLFTALMLIGYMLVILKFQLGANLLHEGFQISNRYFIGLTPIGIIAFIISSIYLIKAHNNRVISVFIIIGLTVLLAFRIFRTFCLVKGILF